MRRTLYKFADVFDRVTEAVNFVYLKAAAGLLAVIVVAMFLQVFTRYVLNASLTGTEELGRYCFVWMNMLGAGLCVNKVSNASVSILNDSLKGKAKLWHSIFLELTIGIMSVVLFIQGISLVRVAVGQVSPALRLPMWMVYASIAAGSAGIVLNALNNILKRWKGELS